MEIKRDEMFQFVRWINLLAGILNLYLFQMGGGYHLLGISLLNIGVWAFTRKPKNNNG
jgi:hypothetical protein